MTQGAALHCLCLKRHEHEHQGRCDDRCKALKGSLKCLWSTVLWLTDEVGLRRALNHPGDALVPQHTVEAGHIALQDLEVLRMTGKC